MPLPKRQTIPKASSKDSAKDSTKPNSSGRFANFETDPKFRLPSRKHAKTKLDPRFSRLRTDPDFQNKASVDRYGRRVSDDTATEHLDHIYASDHGSEDEIDTPKSRKRDDAVRRQLAKAQQRGLDPIRDGGLSSSSEESSSEDNDDDDDEVEDQAELAGDGNEVSMGDVTNRLAAVNLDWDNIRATDIMAVANSFVPPEGRILNVIIYPSDFGLERMQREEIEGPPRAIFAAASVGKKDITAAEDFDASSADDEQIKEDLIKESNGEEFDSKALRTYQLDRLRYYYAVVTCSSPSVAKAIYDNLDGREYLSSANFFDLRFVPDGTDFDADPHDECEELPHGYKPNEFVTGALSHSKVSLTWDADDTTRQEAQKRAFSRKEIDENELKAYLGTDSSSSEDEVEEAKAGKAASLRAALGLAPAGKSSQFKPKSSSKRDRDFKKPDGEMEITFTSGLSTNGVKGSVFENEPEENTLEKYVRKQRERKEKRKERSKAVKEGRNPDAAIVEESAANAEEEDGFDDPFFGSDAEAEKALEIKSKKSKKAKKREEREKLEKESAAERAHLELLMVDDEDSKVQHFDMNEIAKAEKVKKKGKKGKKAVKELLEDNFKMETNDPRFAKLYESHDFAIDPTNPRFKPTAGMNALLEEGRKKRKRDRGDKEPEPKKVKKIESGETDDLKKLAARVKAKSKKVVISFVLASVMTTTASILAMILDQAFDAKGQFTFRAPVRYIRERFLDTEWKKDYAWRPFLDPLIIGLGDQQLITGYAVLLSGWIKVAQNSFEVQGAHFVLILYICALSSSSHLAALITLRKYFRQYKLIAKIRLSMVVVFALFLLASMIAAMSMPEVVVVNHDGDTEKRPRIQRLAFVVPMFFMLIGFSTALVCILYKPRRQVLSPRRTDSWGNQLICGTHIHRRHGPIAIPASFGLRLLYVLFLNPLIAFIIQIILAILSVILVLSQKFSIPEEPERWCGLQDEGENVWGFGQTLSVIMLLLPAMSACQAYLEGRQHIQEGKKPPQWSSE
ncbi:hypothetical protein K458DRAFT_439426 [Lentithecium fluviatile CBS 122367]|uniref:Uncharacterized protein n=1 Tax=Lentithecium fluviatile CBS 122367 TaxID=1168545 RepID=A0A6G1JJ60_9PLEO|nr:hypothetical protein K458DRAFT_439426 [Lentithecium fluviatile CBS 122367]